MGTPPYLMKRVYEAASKGDWDSMKTAYKGTDDKYMMSPITVLKDTAFHLAVYSKKDEPLQSLLRIVSGNSIPGNPCTLQNAYGNTVLHEAVFTGNMKAVELLLQFTPKEQCEYDPSKQLETKNELGETPLYRAASCGKKEIVEYLVIKMKQIYKGKLLEEHRRREKLDKEKNNNSEKVDLKPILHAAIEGQHFETALTLLKRDPSLDDMTDEQGRTCLHLLAEMPSAFKSGRAMLKYSIRNLIYCCLSASNGDDDQSKSKKETEALTLLERDPSLDMTEEQGRTCLHLLAEMPSAFKSGYAMLKYSIRKIYCCLSASNGDDDQSKSKKGHSAANGDQSKSKKGYKVLNFKVELHGNNISEEIQYGANYISYIDIFFICKQVVNDDFKEFQIRDGQDNKVFDDASTLKMLSLHEHQNQIVLVVDTAPKSRPQYYSSEPHKGQNIMHVAVMHRQLEIYNYVKKKFKPIMVRLCSRIDNNGYTLLHQVAHMKHYRGGTKPSPALKLQEEIQWFKRVQRAVPPYLSEKRAPREDPPDNEHKVTAHNFFLQMELEDHLRVVVPPDNEYKLTAHKFLQMEPEDHLRVVVLPYKAMQRDKDCKLTALELFQEEHKAQLKLAQEWIEKTSQSCSAVAVLLATVVFAAAYTIPGGSNDLGFPIFLHNRFFLAFTVLDVIALASSLTSVVMFLSILTSPFEYENFYHNIPRKLIWGFTLLFLSVMTTMLAFACTLFLIIHFRKKWTTGLISFAAFFPVTVFALMQFPLYVSFLSTMKDLFKEVGKYVPRYCCPFRCQRCRKGGEYSDWRPSWLQKISSPKR
ncbi:hypothetical protein BDE02_15G102300 [Populus trichocarpa]|nr:hypothetical protein BDE02_15G102300 [Populus trichocarpa]